MNKRKQFFALIVSLFRSIREAILGNSDLNKFVARHHRLFGFLQARLTKQRFSGLPLTLLGAAFTYALFLFLGLIEDFVTADLIVAIDIRLANLLYIFRSAGLIPVFLWITVLGKSVVVIVLAVIATTILWLLRKQTYVLPLWVVIIGSEFVTFIGKLSLHRNRPAGLVPVYTEHSYSFPSGHATIAMAFYGFLVYALWRNVKHWPSKINILCTGLVVIAAIGFSRLYLGVHFLSDILSGYLLGFLWLIIGVSIVEWQEWRASRNKTELQPIPSQQAVVLSYGLVVLAILFYGSYAWLYQPQLVTSNTEQLSPTLVVERDSLVPAFEQYQLPKFTETLAGRPQEPLSFVLITDNDAQLINSFERAGWYRADQVSFGSVAKIAKAVLSKASFETAPMTPSFWNSQVHTFGFEKPTNTQTVKQRHHARFWRTGLRTPDGKILYIGTASFDISIKWLVVHKIQPDIDTERDVLLQDLQQAGVVTNYREQQFVTPTLGKNFSGDEFFTDGRIYLVETK